MVVLQVTLLWILQAKSEAPRTLTILELKYRMLCTTFDRLLKAQRRVMTRDRQHDKTRLTKRTIVPLASPPLQPASVHLQNLLCSYTDYSRVSQDVFAV